MVGQLPTLTILSFVVAGGVAHNRELEASMSTARNLQQNVNCESRFPHTTITAKLRVFIDPKWGAFNEDTKDHIRRIVSVGNSMLKRDVNFELEIHSFHPYTVQKCEKAFLLNDLSRNYAMPGYFNHLFATCIGGGQAYIGGTNRNSLCDGKDGKRCTGVENVMAPREGRTLNEREVHIYVHEVAHNLGAEHPSAWGASGGLMQSNSGQYELDGRNKCKIFALLDRTMKRPGLSTLRYSSGAQQGPETPARDPMPPNEVPVSQTGARSLRR